MSEVSAVDQIGFPILTVLLVLPLAVAVLLAIVRHGRLLWAIAMTGALAEVGLSIVLIANFKRGTAEFQFGESASWIGSGVGYRVAVDGISVLFVPLTAAVIAVVLYSTRASIRHSTAGYLIAICAFESATIGVFIAVDLILFFVFWEFLLVSTYALVRGWGAGPNRTKAATKYVLYMLTGSGALLAGFILLGLAHRDANPGGVMSFDLVKLMNTDTSSGIQTTVFFLLAFAFAIKAPLFPFHGWMPSVMIESPIGLAVLLAGLKVGVYGFLRIVMPLAPDAFSDWKWLLATLGVAGVLYGALVALAQRNMRGLVTFASVSHVGMAMLGLASLNTQGSQGALFLIFNLGLTSTAMLLAAGFVHERVGETDLAALGGLAQRAPMLAAFCLVASLGMIALPATSGFPGEFLVMLGSFKEYGWATAVVVLTVVLTAGYVLAFFERAFHGPVRTPAVDSITDLRGTEAFTAFVLCVTIVLFGIFPGWLLSVTESSVEMLLAR